MFPILALGAAALIGVFTATEMSSSSSKKPAAKKPEAQVVESPQSYIVTPVDGGQARRLTPIEAVRNFIV